MLHAINVHNRSSMHRANRIEKGFYFVHSFVFFFFIICFTRVLFCLYTQICHFVVNSVGQNRYHRHINRKQLKKYRKKKQNFVSFFFSLSILSLDCRVKSIFFSDSCSCLSVCREFQYSQLYFTVDALALVHRAYKV